MICFLILRQLKLEWLPATSSLVKKRGSFYSQTLVLQTQSKLTILSSSLLWPLYTRVPHFHRRLTDGQRYLECMLPTDYFVHFGLFEKERSSCSSLVHDCKVTLSSVILRLLLILFKSLGEHLLLIWTHSQNRATLCPAFVLCISWIFLKKASRRPRVGRTSFPRRHLAISSSFAICLQWWSRECGQ